MTTELNLPAPYGETLSNPRSEAMDAILGQKFDVLDKGHIRVIDYMGTDAAIVQAARVSYGKGTKTPSEDVDLIRFLMRHEHTTPFEMCEVKIHIRIPMDAWRQMIRQRTASVNEYSTRYSEAINDKQCTISGEWRAQSTTNKQGSGHHLDEEGVGFDLSAAEAAFHTHASDLYKHRLDLGVAREQARKDLPLSTYTEAYWKIDLHNLMNFLRKRMKPDAQLEIRSFANVLGHQILKIWLPHTYQAFLDYRLNAHTFSGPQMELINDLMRTHLGQTSRTVPGIANKREHGEFMRALGLK